MDRVVDGPEIRYRGAFCHLTLRSTAEERADGRCRVCWDGEIDGKSYSGIAALLIAGEGEQEPPRRAMDWIASCIRATFVRAVDEALGGKGVTLQ